MSFAAVAISFAFINCIMMLIGGVLYLRDGANITVRKSIYPLAFNVVINTLLYVNVRFNLDASLFNPCLLVFEIFLLINLVILSLETVPIHRTIKKWKFMLVIFIFTCIVMAISHLLFYDFLHVNHPEVYSLCSSLIVTNGCILIFLYSSPKLSQLHFKAIIGSFLGLTVLFVLSTVFDAPWTAIINLNLLFILILIVHLLFQFTTEQTTEKLEDFPLSQRQLEIARLILKGLTYAQIGDELHIAENTASKHGSNIFAITDCQDKANFVVKFRGDFRVL